jgi:hypothetical protein
MLFPAPLKQVMMQTPLVVHLAMTTRNKDFILLALCCAGGLMLTALPLTLTSIKWAKASKIPRILCKPLVLVRTSASVCAVTAFVVCVGRPGF